MIMDMNGTCVKVVTIQTPTILGKDLLVCATFDRNVGLFCIPTSLSSYDPFPSQEAIFSFLFEIDLADIYVHHMYAWYDIFLEIPVLFKAYYQKNAFICEYIYVELKGLKSGFSQV